MNRIRLSELRRQELEKAAYESAMKHGFQGLALHRIASHAGTAKGTIHHYFRDKEELMLGSVRYANRLYAETMLRLLKAAKSPSERLWVIIAVNLAGEFFQPLIMRAYVLTIANGIRYPSLLRAYEITHDRSLSNVVFALRSLSRPENVKPIANTIWTMVEGAWLLQTTRRENIAGATLAAIADYLKKTVPTFDISVIRNLDHFPEGPTPSHNRA
jgi:TetR/AcrR family transcriptional regulator, transcriptional repressor of bet genes